MNIRGFSVILENWIVWNREEWSVDRQVDALLRS